jgi:predicted Zn-dependent peptidase
MWSELLMRGAGGLSSREHADALDRLGVGRSADVGTYHLRIGATMLGERVVEALPLLVDMVRRPRFDAESVEPARDLALQAIESLKDDPQERAVTGARSRHYPTPFNRSSLGTVAGLTALTREELVDGWAERARPRGSFMGVAGAVDADAVERRLNELLRGWSGEGPEPRPSGTPPRGYAHELDQSNQVQVIAMMDAPPEPHASSLLEKVVMAVLSGGMAGRLFTEVREKRGLCYSVSASYAPGKEIGSVLAYVGTTPERAQESLNVLLAELERIGTRAGAVTGEEFERAMIGMKSRLVFGGESTSARASSLAYDMHRIGRARSLEEIAGELATVTVGRVNEYLAGRKMGRVTIQTLGPAELKPPG